MPERMSAAVLAIERELAEHLEGVCIRVLQEHGFEVGEKILDEVWTGLNRQWWVRRLLEDFERLGPSEDALRSVHLSMKIYREMLKRDACSR